MKKIISVLLSLLIFITSIFICNPITANAADTTNRNYIVCNGYYVRDKGSYQIRLYITGIDFENEEFKGLFAVSGSKTFFQEITGIFKTKDVPTLEGFEYLVSFDVSWGDSSYYLDLNDSTGHLNGGTTCSYEGLIGRLDC